MAPFCIREKEACKEIIKEKKRYYERKGNIMKEDKERVQRIEQLLLHKINIK